MLDVAEPLVDAEDNISTKLKEKGKQRTQPQNHPLSPPPSLFWSLVNTSIDTKLLVKCQRLSYKSSCFAHTGSSTLILEELVTVNIDCPTTKPPSKVFHPRDIGA